MKKIKIVIIATIGLIAAACQPPGSGRQESEIEYLHMPGTADSGLPFSSAVRVDNTIYLSGMIGLEPGTLQPAAGGIEGEARAAMEEIKKTLETFGSSMDRVVKCTVFLADEADRDAFNVIYMSYFDNLPARSGVTVKGLALGAKVEVECIAVVN
jgi:2-iminobutanoate/2-iminopropanoate deaminase